VNAEWNPVLKCIDLVYTLGADRYWIHLTDAEADQLLADLTAMYASAADGARNDPAQSRWGGRGREHQGTACDGDGGGDRQSS
jgi:hypothetical protein